MLLFSKNNHLIFKLFATAKLEYMIDKNWGTIKTGKQ